MSTKPKTKTERPSLHYGGRREKPTAKPKPAWAIYRRKCMLVWSIRTTKTDAIAEIVRNNKRPWNELMAYGYSVAKVSVQPV